ncbi:DUF2249 domain-containing protein [Candidatus Halobonum tyrrellensis]|nr:DUF2249 domain-containing protein [Candidatus Halobonum tyrrellensis]
MEGDVKATGENEPPNVFGTTVWVAPTKPASMESDAELVAESAAPRDRPVERIDVGELPPPEPLRETLERLAELDDEAILVQTNDRAPQHLYPQLSDRGYEFETFERGESVTTVIWSGRNAEEGD